MWLQQKLKNAAGTVKNVTSNLLQEKQVDSDKKQEQTAVTPPPQKQQEVNLLDMEDQITQEMTITELINRFQQNDIGCLQNQFEMWKNFDNQFQLLKNKIIGMRAEASQQLDQFQPDLWNNAQIVEKQNCELVIKVLDQLPIQFEFQQALTWNQFNDSLSKLAANIKQLSQIKYAPLVKENKILKTKLAQQNQDQKILEIQKQMDSLKEEKEYFKNQQIQSQLDYNQLEQQFQEQIAHLNQQIKTQSEVFLLEKSMLNKDIDEYILQINSLQDEKGKFKKMKEIKLQIEELKLNKIDSASVTQMQFSFLQEELESKILKFIEKQKSEQNHTHQITSCEEELSDEDLKSVQQLIRVFNRKQSDQGVKDAIQSQQDLVPKLLQYIHHLQKELEVLREQPTWSFDQNPNQSQENSELLTRELESQLNQLTSEMMQLKNEITELKQEKESLEEQNENLICQNQQFQEKIEKLALQLQCEVITATEAQIQLPTDIGEELKTKSPELLQEDQQMRIDQQTQTDSTEMFEGYPTTIKQQEQFSISMNQPEYNASAFDVELSKETQITLEQCSQNTQVELQFADQNTSTQNLLHEEIRQQQNQLIQVNFDSSHQCIQTEKEESNQETQIMVDQVNQTTQVSVDIEHQITQVSFEESAQVRPLQNEAENQTQQQLIESESQLVQTELLQEHQSTQAEVILEHQTTQMTLELDDQITQATVESGHQETQIMVEQNDQLTQADVIEHQHQLTQTTQPDHEQTVLVEMNNSPKESDTNLQNLNYLTKENDELKYLIDEVRQKNSSIIQELNNKQRQNDRLGMQIQDYYNQNESLQQLTENLMIKLSEYESTQLKQFDNQNQMFIEELETRNYEYQRTIIELQQSIKNYEHDKICLNEEVQKKIAYLLQQVDETIIKFQDQLQVNDELKSEIQLKDNQLESLTVEGKSMQSNYEFLERIHDDNIKKMDELKAENLQLRSERGNKLDEQQDLILELQQQQKEQDRLQKDYFTLEQIFNNSQQKIKELQNQLTNVEENEQPMQQFKEIEKFDKTTSINDSFLDQQFDIQEQEIEQGEENADSDKNEVLLKEILQENQKQNVELMTELLKGDVQFSETNQSENLSERRQYNEKLLQQVNDNLISEIENIRQNYELKSDNSNKSQEEQLTLLELQNKNRSLILEIEEISNQRAELQQTLEKYEIELSISGKQQSEQVLLIESLKQQLKMLEQNNSDNELVLKLIELEQKVKQYQEYELVKENLIRIQQSQIDQHITESQEFKLKLSEELVKNQEQQQTNQRLIDNCQLLESELTILKENDQKLQNQVEQQEFINTENNYNQNLKIDSLVNEQNRFEEQIVGLQDQLLILQSERSNMQAQLQQDQSELQNFNSQLDDANKTLTQLKNILEEKEELIAKQHSELSRNQLIQEEFDSHKLLHQEQVNEHSELQDKLQQNVDLLNDYIKQLKEKTGIIDAQKEELLNLNNQIFEQNKQYQQLSLTLVKLEEQSNNENDQMNSELQSREQKIREQEREIELYQHNMIDSKQYIDQLERDYQQHREQESKLKQELQTMLSQLQKEEQENSSNVDLIIELEGKCEKAVDQRNEMEKEYNQIKDKINHLESDYITKNEQYIQLYEEANSVREQLKIKQQQLQNVQRLNEEAQIIQKSYEGVLLEILQNLSNENNQNIDFNQIEKLKQSVLFSIASVKEQFKREIENLTQQLKQQQKITVEVKQQNNDLQQKIVISGTEYSKKEQQINQELLQFQTKFNESVEKANSIYNQLQKSEQKRKESEKQILDLEKAKKEQIDEIKQKGNEIETLRQTLSKKQIEISGLQNQLQNQTQELQKMAELNKLIVGKNCEIQQLNKKVVTYEETIEQLQQSVINFQFVNEAAQQKFDVKQEEYEIKIKELKDSLLEYAKQIDERHQDEQSQLQIQDLQQKIRKKEETIVVLQNEKESLLENCNKKFHQIAQNQQNMIDKRIIKEALLNYFDNRAPQKIRQSILQQLCCILTMTQQEAEKIGIQIHRLNQQDIQQKQEQQSLKDNLLNYLLSD